jgi:hypothetical protein
VARAINCAVPTVFPVMSKYGLYVCPVGITTELATRLKAWLAGGSVLSLRSRLTTSGLVTALSTYTRCVVYTWPWPIVIFG